MEQEQDAEETSETVTSAWREWRLRKGVTAIAVPTDRQSQPLPQTTPNGEG